MTTGPRIPEWWDMYEFEDRDTVVRCPDCEVLSPSLRDVRAAAEWVIQHGGECPA